MMDCRHVQELLPLWVGQDLPDMAQSAEVSRHLEGCQECGCRRARLQASLEALQLAGSEARLKPLSQQPLWPRLASRIAVLDVRRHRARFNGWIPASVMSLAVALMVAVSVPSIQEAFFGVEPALTSADDLFAEPPVPPRSRSPKDTRRSLRNENRATPVSYPADPQW